MNHFVCDALAGSFRVHAALNGKEGFALARSLRPDLIICDYMMPEMSGDELVRAVRAEPRMDATPILILTARNDATARIDVLREGANDYLLKPFFQPELRARVDNLIKVRQAELHLRALQVAQERDRIARDLHDLVIQRVFGAGMRLSSMLPAAEGQTAERLREVVAELDSVISDIRTTIFDLQTEAAVRGGLRTSVRHLATDAGERLGFEPRVRFAGPVDTVVDREVEEQMLAVLRESLSNVIRHAAATSVRDRGDGRPRAGAAGDRRRPGRVVGLGRGLRAQEHGRPRRLAGRILRPRRPQPPRHRPAVAGTPRGPASRDLNAAP